jgi:hypothetical protein
MMISRFTIGWREHRFQDNGTEEQKNKSGTGA